MFHNAYLGMISFTASLHKVDECQTNGLPRLPHSIDILGRFEELKCIDHPNLCRYIDAKRDKHERIVLGTEYYSSSWDKDYPNVNIVGMERVIDLFIKLVSAVEYLHNRGVIVKTLAPKNILYTMNEKAIKVVNYGLYYMTNNGVDVDFPIGHVSYLPPEAFLNDCLELSCPRSDVWSIGMLLLRSIVPIELLNNFPNEEILNIILFDEDVDVVSNVFPDHTLLDPSLLSIVRKCLRYDVQDRISIKSLKLELSELQRVSSKLIIQEHQYSIVDDVRTMYYLWTLAGGDLWKVHEQLCDLQCTKLPAILTLPIVIRGNADALWSSKVAPVVKRPFSDILYPLPVSKLLERLEKLPKSILYEPRLCLTEDFKPFDFSKVQFRSLQSDEERIIRSQPIWVKETDFEYQFRRISKFRRLIRGYPLTRTSLLIESAIDIPPLLRAEIWPLLLRVDADAAAVRYRQVQGRLLPEKAASQIAVDLPRCHSYDELIVSSEGQLKLGRILHAWLLHHPTLEYTQGMDSLCAVFARLMFHQDEAVAFACLEMFVDRFMGGLFCSRHGQALTEYYAVLQQLLAFHNPGLSQAVNVFNITGFTASWIYTGFAHSLPLDKTVRLWDSVILGESSFLMMVFLALLGQLDQESAFSSQASEQVFSVLSNLPEFDLDRCRQDAIELARRTPPSTTRRSVDSDSTIAPAMTTVDNQNRCARISLQDLLLIIGESPPMEEPFSPFMFDSKMLPSPILIDLRKKDNFEKGSIPGSINIPIVSASPSTTFAELESRNAHALVCQNGPHVKVIIGTVDDHLCDSVAKVLINSYRSQYVCILAGGINAVRASRPDILVVTH